MWRAVRTNTQTPLPLRCKKRCGDYMREFRVSLHCLFYKLGQKLEIFFFKCELVTYCFFVLAN